MTHDDLKTAIAEAQRFLHFAVEAKAIMEGKPVRTYYDYALKQQVPVDYKGSGYGPANAAARRASMDLTRALAKMRKY